MTEAVGGAARGQRTRESPYQRWQKGEGIPINTGSYVADLYTLEVKPWARTGQRGAFVNLADQEQDDAYVLEIAPAGETEVIHHLFEAGFFVLDGRGATSFWQQGTARQTVEWQRGSVVSPPLNCYYQHFNLDGGRPARLFAVTNAPMIINLYRNLDVVFSDSFVFSDRYAAEDDYFVDPGQFDEAASAWRTNFVPDIRSFKLRERTLRGAGNLGMQILLANNQMIFHCSDFPPGVYKKAHRHGVGAHVLVLDGIGYSLLSFEGEERRKVDWKDGSVLSPKQGEYHQHFNTGPGRARYMAFRLGALDPHRPEPQQIEYEQEDPGIYDLYVEECARHGAKVLMPRPSYRAR